MPGTKISLHGPYLWCTCVFLFVCCVDRWVPQAVVRGEGQCMQRLSVEQWTYGTRIHGTAGPYRPAEGHLHNSRSIIQEPPLFSGTTHAYSDTLHRDHTQAPQSSGVGSFPPSRRGLMKRKIQTGGYCSVLQSEINHYRLIKRTPGADKKDVIC